MRWYLAVLKKYASISGRASRREFWTFVLFNLVVSVGLRVIDYATGLTHGGQGFLQSFFALVIFIPSLAVAVRRLQDLGKSGWSLLVGLIPFVGVVILLYWYIRDGNPGENAYGPRPGTSPDA